MSTGPGRRSLLGPGVPSTSHVVPGSAPTAALSPGQGVSMLSWTDGHAAGLARMGGHGGWEGAGVSPGRWEGASPSGWWQQQEVPRRVWGGGLWSLLLGAGGAGGPRHSPVPSRSLVSPRATPPCTSPRSTAIARSWSCSSSASVSALPEPPAHARGSRPPQVPAGSRCHHSPGPSGTGPSGGSGHQSRRGQAEPAGLQRAPGRALPELRGDTGRGPRHPP